MTQNITGRFFDISREQVRTVAFGGREVFGYVCGDYQDPARALIVSESDAADVARQLGEGWEAWTIPMKVGTPIHCVAKTA